MQAQPALLLLLLLALLPEFQGLEKGSPEQICCSELCRPATEEDTCVCQKEPAGCPVACCCAWDYSSVEVEGATVSAWQCLEPANREGGGIAVSPLTLIAIIVPIVVTFALCGGCLYFLYLKGAEQEDPWGFDPNYGEEEGRPKRRGSVIENIQAGAKVTVRRLSEQFGNIPIPGRRNSTISNASGERGRRGSQTSNAGGTPIAGVKGRRGSNISLEGGGVGGNQGYRRRKSMVEAAEPSNSPRMSTTKSRRRSSAGSAAGLPLESPSTSPMAGTRRRGGAPQDEGLYGIKTDSQDHKHLMT